MDSAAAAAAAAQHQRSGGQRRAPWTGGDNGQSIKLGGGGRDDRYLAGADRIAAGGVFPTRLGRVDWQRAATRRRDETRRGKRALWPGAEMPQAPSHKTWREWRQLSGVLQLERWLLAAGCCWPPTATAAGRPPTPAPVPTPTPAASSPTASHACFPPSPLHNHSKPPSR